MIIIYDTIKGYWRSGSLWCHLETQRYVFLAPSKLHKAITGNLLWSIRYHRHSLQHKEEGREHIWAPNKRDTEQHGNPRHSGRTTADLHRTGNVQTEHVQKAQQRQAQTAKVTFHSRGAAIPPTPASENTQGNHILGSRTFVVFWLIDSWSQCLFLAGLGPL